MNEWIKYKINIFFFFCILSKIFLNYGVPFVIDFVVKKSKNNCLYSKAYKIKYIWIRNNRNYHILRNICKTIFLLIYYFYYSCFKYNIINGKSIKINRKK